MYTSQEIANTAVNPPANKNNHNFNLDLLRILAFSFVPLVHFFYNTEFYSIDVNGITMYISLCLRNLGYSCISLFLLLTGYLQCNKAIPITSRYFVKILKFVVPYLLFVFTTIIYAHFTQSEVITPSLVLKAITTYPGYSWYVEMYIGLFLLIPFLNIIWQNLKTRQEEHILLGIMIFLALLPSIVNVYDFTQARWWGINKSTIDLIPEFWVLLYPVAFYFIGGYISKHKDTIAQKLKPAYAFLLFAALFVLFSVYCIVRNIGESPAMYSWLHQNSFGLGASSTALLIFVTSIRFKKVPTPVRHFASTLSKLTYSAYLMSFLADKTVYTYLEKLLPAYTQKLKILPVAVLTVIILSFIMAFFIDLVSGLIIKLIEKLISLIAGKKHNKTQTQ